MAMDKITYHSFLFMCLFCLIFNACSDYSKNLGDGYTYVHEGSGANCIFHEYPAKGGEIPPDVISYDYDKKFIIAKQKPNEFDCAYEKGFIYSLGRDTVYYWLIIKKEQKVFGALDYDSFLQLKRKYNVPANLKLE
jgi:hypothetical protein